MRRLPRVGPRPKRWSRTSFDIGRVLSLPIMFHCRKEDEEKEGEQEDVEESGQ